MPSITFNASPSCDGSGGLISGNWSAVNIQDATVTITGDLTAFTSTETYTGVGSGNFVFTGLPDDVYEVALSGTIDGEAAAQFVTVACGVAPSDCDLVINSVTTVATTNGLNNGRATINATGTGTIEYSIDNVNWQTNPLFIGLPVNAYTAYIRKQNQLSCTGEFVFQITAAPVAGCTNPEADNYDPAATVDNGTCFYTSRFYACGGVLPNPVFIGVNFPVLTNGVAKANHYVKVNIYRAGETTPFATATQTLRNGSAQVDIGRYLRSQFTNAYPEPTAQVIYRDNLQSFGFHVGIVEHFNGIAQPEKLRVQPVKVAVNAALPEYTDTVEPYLIKGTVAIPENPNPGV